MPFNFQTTDDWTPNMFQAFLQFCWIKKQTPTPRCASRWRKNHWKA